MGSICVTVGEDLISGVDFNFRLNYKYTLNIAAGAGGTIDPSPGIHTFCEETEVTIEAIPDADYGFSHWSGDVPQGFENNNPITITLDSDKSITANFAITPTTETGGGDGGGKKGGCFIATAAYGSPLHPHLDILRDFRDTYLLPSKFGRVIVDFYYKYSPFVANLVAKYKVLRVVIRIHLMPLVAFSYLMLHFNTAVTTVFFVFIFALPVFLFVLIKKGERG